MFRKCFKRRKDYFYYSEKIAKLIHENSDKYVSSKTLYKLLELYKKWKKCARICRSQFFERDVLHYIAEKVYWLDFNDEDFIFTILYNFYQVDNNFGYVLCPPNSDQYAKAKNMHFDQSGKFTEFFLRHANNKHIEVLGRRIFDWPVTFRSFYCHPCEVAIRLGEPESLRVLLRYGAFTTDAQISARTVNCHKNILRAIAYITRTILEIKRSDPSAIVPENNPRYDCMISCGTLMMRVCPQIQKRFIFRRWSFIYMGSLLPESAFKWVALNDLPDLESRVFLPMTLKQACKVKIRNALKNKWQLPMGIQKLPIPPQLKNYLDLYCD